MTSVVSVEVSDLRFPTGAHRDGSDAMNPDPDYSAAYVVVRTDDENGPEGHGFTFTIGRGNEIVCAAVESLRGYLVGEDVEGLAADMGAFARRLTGDSQLRWLGPEKGVMALATAAVLNAVWDLIAKRAGKPLWLYLAEMSPAELVALCDFRYLSDAMTPQWAQQWLESLEPTRAERIEQVRAEGLPAYTTSAGWLGYSDDKVRSLASEAIADGWTAFKLKVGANIEDDRRRLGIIRSEIGPDARLMVDANQVWDVNAAVTWVDQLREYDLWWVEEPTSPDDVLGHAAIARQIAPTKVATGEMVQNRIVFKQLFQAGAIGICQLDSARTASVNEAIAIMLLAARFGVPVCPHAGGVGLCEYVQHLSAFNFVAVAPSLDEVNVEFVDHLHEHFVDPVRVEKGRYLVPLEPGYSAQIKSASRAAYTYPGGNAWSTM